MPRPFSTRPTLLSVGRASNKDLPSPLSVATVQQAATPPAKKTDRTSDPVFQHPTISDPSPRLCRTTPPNSTSPTPAAVHPPLFMSRCPASPELLGSRNEISARSAHASPPPSSVSVTSTALLRSFCNPGIRTRGAVHPILEPWFLRLERQVYRL
jgi:hypothetical protein